MKQEHAIECVVYSGKSINASSGDVQSILDILGATDAQRAKDDREAVRWIEVRQHSAAFHYGNSDHSDKDVQAAYAPYFRHGNYHQMANTYLRAVADAAITSVVIEVGYATTAEAAARKG